MPDKLNGPMNWLSKRLILDTELMMITCARYQLMLSLWLIWVGCMLTPRLLIGNHRKALRNAPAI